MFKKKRRWMIIALVLLVLAFSFGRKGKKTEVAQAPSASHVEVSEADTTQTAAKTPDYYYGTWTLAGLTDGKNGAYLDDLIQKGTLPEEAREWGFVFKDTGEYYFAMDAFSEVKTWEVSENGVLCDGEEEPLVGNVLLVPFEKEVYMMFQKTSASQDYPDTEEAEEEKENTEKDDTDGEEVSEEEYEDSEAEKSKEKETHEGIRPEFKEAMDSYEAFFNDYCDFLKKYAENPSDLTLLAEYASMMAKESEMQEAFDKWEESEMSNEELAYYIDVNARIQKKLLEVYD